jgi:transcriptional regulator with XRE-family HTH domain
MLCNNYMARPTNRERHSLSIAVSELRHELGETQQQFAGRLGVAVTTIARYETSHPPSGMVLDTLRLIAEANKRNDLARAFRVASEGNSDYFIRLEDGEEFEAVLAYVRKLRKAKHTGKGNSTTRFPHVPLTVKETSANIRKIR